MCVCVYKIFSLVCAIFKKAWAFMCSFMNDSSLLESTLLKLPMRYAMEGTHFLFFFQHLKKFQLVNI